jgi:hypothetical protein
MKAMRNRVLGIALVPLVGLGLTFACVACGQKTEPGVASGGTPASSGASGAAGGGSWAAYDTTMRAFVTCMHEHGKTGVRYEGHKDTALTFDDELSGMPKGAPVAAAPVGQSQSLDARSACMQATFGDRSYPGNRPQPYTQPTVPADERVKNQAFSKCMREHGFTDYPDPDPAIGEVRSLPPRYGTDDDNKADVKEKIPGLRAAAKTCYAQTGKEQHEGG